MLQLYVSKHSPPEPKTSFSLHEIIEMNPNELG